MAAQGPAVVEQVEMICCPICLELLNNPVTTSCGHSYCMDCIKASWDLDDHKRVYSCPLCNEKFTPRPVLKKNTLLAELVEKLKKTGLQPTRPAHTYAGPGDVPCDVCTGRKQRATKSCLTCVASYCETHLQPHYESPAFQKHSLAQASTQLLRAKWCYAHDEVMKVWCRTDQKCICSVCAQFQHERHDTVSTAEERSEKQKKLGSDQQEIQQRIQKREKDLKELQKAVTSFKSSAQTAERDSEKIFTELSRSIDKRWTAMKKVIRDQQKLAVSQAENLRDGLEKELSDLRKRNVDLDKLSHTEDHTHFLQSYQSLSNPFVSLYPNVIVAGRQYFSGVYGTVSALRKKLDTILTAECHKISTAVELVELLLPEPTTREEDVQSNLPSPVDGGSVRPRVVSRSPEASKKQKKKLKKKQASLLSPEPTTREDFLQYSCQLTLNPDTAHRKLSISKKKRMGTCVDEDQPYPDHPERFTDCLQVLCRQALSGRCYWETESSGGGVYTAVSYKDIGRTGIACDSRLGSNDKSWSLSYLDDGYTFRHNDVGIPVPGPQSSRVGVYLDHRAGSLSFYNVSDTMTLIHKVQTTFTEPLYPGFALDLGSSVELCELE